MGDSITWQQTTLMGGCSQFESLKSAAESVKTAVQTAGDLVSTGLDAAGVFISGSVNPALAAFVGVCDEVIALIENIEQAGFYFATVDPYTPGIGIMDKTTFIQYLPPDRAIRSLSSALTDTGDERRPQYNDSASVGALVIFVGTYSLVELIPVLRSLGILLGVEDWEELADDLQEIDFSPYDKERNKKSSASPDFTSVRFAEGVPLVGDALIQLKGVFQSIKASAEGGTKAFERISKFIKKKNAHLQNTVKSFVKGIETAVSAAENSGVYILEIPAEAGGITRIQSELDRAAGTLPSELKYSAAALIVADGAALEIIKGVLL